MPAAFGSASTPAERPGGRSAPGPGRGDGRGAPHPVRVRCPTVVETAGAPTLAASACKGTDGAQRYAEEAWVSWRRRVKTRRERPDARPQGATDSKPGQTAPLRKAGATAS